eukprot:1579734-Rhodomonas_salina.1
MVTAYVLRCVDLRLREVAMLGHMSCFRVKFRSTSVTQEDGGSIGVRCLDCEEDRVDVHAVIVLSLVVLELGRNDNWVVDGSRWE